MVGAKVTAYGIEPRKDSVLDAEHIFKVVQSRLFKLNNADEAHRILQSRKSILFI